MKTLKSNFRLLGLVFTSSSIFLLTTVLAPAPSYSAPVATFACIYQGKDYVTVVRRGNRITPPIIVWKDTSFGKKYPPQKRCQIVSQRLTKAVSRSVTLSSLDMTHGVVNSIPVICSITSKREKCNADNILFSLKASELGQEEKIVTKLLSFSKNATAESLERVSPPPTFGEMIENVLETSEATNPNSTEQPPK